MPSSPQKVALVTGAARGIGLATAKRFFAEGWQVALLDIEGELLRGAVAGLADPDNTLALHCDVSDAKAVANAIAAASERFGRLDALVNNAGIAAFAPLLETPDDDWNRILQVNLTGPFLCTKAAAPLMREHGGGAIVNITSISAVRASTLRSAYGTSKAGLAHLTKQLAVELASLGIRVNAVAPGPVETAMAKQVHTPEIRADYHDAIPLNRYGLEEELAEAIFFLCSDRASYITGQILAVDGGFDAAGIGLPTLRGQRRERVVPQWLCRLECRSEPSENRLGWRPIIAGSRRQVIVQRAAMQQHRLFRWNIRPHARRSQCERRHEQ